MDKLHKAYSSNELQILNFFMDSFCQLTGTVLLQKLIVVKLVKKLPAINQLHTFITRRHKTLPQAKPLPPLPYDAPCHYPTIHAFARLVFFLTH
jgi:hypothetical protein